MPEQRINHLRSSDGHFRRESQPRRSDFREAGQAIEKLHEGPVNRAEQITLAMTAPLHGDAKRSCRVPDVNEIQSAIGHRRNLARHEVEHDLGRTEPIITGPQQQAGVHDD